MAYTTGLSSFVKTKGDIFQPKGRPKHLNTLPSNSNIKYFEMDGCSFRWWYASLTSRLNPNCRFLDVNLSTFKVSYLIDFLAKCEFTSLRSTTSLNPPEDFGSKWQIEMNLC